MWIWKKFKSLSNRLQSRLSSLKKGLFFDQRDTRFFKYLTKNKTSVSIDAVNARSRSITLVEFCPNYHNLIGLHFFLKALRVRSNSSFVSYILFPPKVWTNLFLFKFKKFYRLIGVQEFIHCYPNDSFAKEVEEFKKLHSTHVKSKRDLELLRFDNVWVGDSIYDSYLYHYHKPTVDLESPEFQAEMDKAIYYYLFWKKYFSENNVESVIVSHTVYSHFNIISRLAISMGIQSFQVNDQGLYRMSPERTFGYHEYFDYKKIVESLPTDIQKRGMEWALERLKKRYSGEVGVDMSYSSKSAWTDTTKCELIVPSTRKKIFLALHCFFDNPHPYGINLFPDFHEWLHFLGKISEETDYDWYLKTHPDFLPGNLEIVEQFLKIYKKFKLLPSSTSHHSIIAGGVDFALTVFGTIGMEYAFQGIPVINASQCNVHIAFDFNVHPQSVDEYRKILMSLDKFKFEINRSEVLQYYFAKNLICRMSWIWKDPEDMMKSIGGVNGTGSSKIIDYFFKFLNADFEKRSLSKAEKFLDSNVYSIYEDIPNFLKSNDSFSEIPTSASR